MTIQRILLDDDRFTQSLRQYIADEKPDPIQTKQLESWQMTWTNHHHNDDADGGKKEARSENSDDSSIIPILNFTPTHAISGTLQISNEYMILTFVTNCVWMGDMPKNGSIRFTCHASARPNNNKNTVSATSDGIEAPSNKKKKDSARHSTMVERLCRDEYIRKILLPTTTDTENDIHVTDDRHLFCSASIDIKSNENEERVYCDEAIGEAIRRTVYSSSDSVLDIVDLLFRLPYLPCTSGSTSSSSSNNNSSSTNHPNTDGTDCPAVVTTTTKLADRVRLRLLEEATYDVCDNEPDDELVDDLSIQDKNKNDEDGDDDNDGNMDGPAKAPPTAVNSRKNKKVKR